MFKKKESGIGQSVVRVQQQVAEQKKYTFAVGNIQNSMVTLVDDEYNMIQLYDYLLPDVQPGNIITLTIKRNFAQEQARKASLQKLHKLILKQQQFTKSNSLLKES